MAELCGASRAKAVREAGAFVAIGYIGLFRDGIMKL